MVESECWMLRLWSFSSNCAARCTSPPSSPRLFFAPGAPA